MNSPRRILSFSRNRCDDLCADRSPRFGVSGENGPKLSEVYGFVGSITTVDATVICIIWVYFPDSWLHSIGIYYYPSRYWTLAVPTYVMARYWIIYRPEVYVYSSSNIHEHDFRDTWLSFDFEVVFYWLPVMTRPSSNIR